MLKQRITPTRRVVRGQIAVRLNLQRRLKLHQLVRPLSGCTHSGGTGGFPVTPERPGLFHGLSAPGSAVGSSGMRTPLTEGYVGIAGARTIFGTLA
jgi:hypothetical protein